MKIPDKCPCCGGILLNDFIDFINTHRKSCLQVLGHSFVIDIKQNTEEIKNIELQIGKVEGKWLCVIKELFVIIEGKVEEIPFFEPNLSDCTKLIEKLKTYIILL